jgi:hypothetical protein
MDQSPKFNKVKQYFDNNLWDINKVKNAVIHNWITEDEFKEITTLDYTK